MASSALLGTLLAVIGLLPRRAILLDGGEEGGESCVRPMALRVKPCRLATAVSRLWKVAVDKRK